LKDDKISYAKPNKTLTEKPSIKKYLKYLLFFGPGAIVASLTVGQGQLIIGPQIGAWSGFALLWLITLNIGSYIIGYIGIRFTMLSGIGVMDLFALKTYKGWLNWILIAIMLVFIPIFTATIMTSLGQAISWILGFGNYLFWGVSICLFAGFLALLGRYKLLEITQVLFVAVLAIGAIVAVISINPDLFEILPNFFTIGQNVPNNYPSWVINNYPSVTRTPIPLLMLGYLGTLTFTLITLIGYLGWIKIKKWGIFRGRSDPVSFSEKCYKLFEKNKEITYLPDGTSEIKKSKILLKPLLVDLSLAFIIVSIISACYIITGSLLLGSRQILPDDTRLVQNQLVIFTYLADWLKPIFQISVIFALFGTVYSGFEAGTRMLFETSKNLIPRVKNFEYKRFMMYVLLYIVVVSIPLAIRMYVDPNFSVLFFLSITLLFIGVIGVVIYGIGVIFLSQKYLPSKYKLSMPSLIIGIIGVILLIIPFLFIFL